LERLEEDVVLRITRHGARDLLSAVSRFSDRRGWFASVKERGERAPLLQSLARPREPPVPLERAPRPEAAASPHASEAAPCPGRFGGRGRERAKRRGRR